MDSKQFVIKTAPNCARKRKERKVLTIASPCAAILLTAILLLTRVGESTASSSPPDDPPPSYWRKGYAGHGTTHEAMGTLHFAEVQYSKYEPLSNYSQRENFPHIWTDDFFKFSRTFFDHMLPHDLSIPRGYIKDLGTDNMRLGPKVTEDDWAVWLNQFWAIWLWILLMVAIIVLAPFVGVVYFCFCCHRCKLSCPACHRGAGRKRILWGFCLILIIPIIAGSMALAFSSNKQLERGLRITKTTFEIGSIDTCNFLKDVSDHIHHLFVTNYQEMEIHLVNTLAEAPKHFLTDLNDVASDNSAAMLAHLFDDLIYVKYGIGQIDLWTGWVAEWGIRIRNELRAVKRDVNYAMVTLCGSYECLKFLHTADIEYIDTSRCLHMDERPHVDRMLEDMDEILKELPDPPSFRGPITRLEEISRELKDALARVSPAIIRDLRKGKRLFARESRRIEDIIDVVISDIHLFTIRSSRAFGDLYELVNDTRQFVDLYISVSFIVIMSILILALVIGCVAPAPTGASDEYFTTKIASHLLILAMICIFCALSVMLTVVLFYFVIGGVAYKGACAPLTDLKSRALLKQLDSEINLRTMFSLRNVGAAAANESTDPIRVSTVVDACQGDDFVFNYLQDHKIFDIDDFLRVKILAPAERESLIDVDLSKKYLLTDSEKKLLMEIEESEVGLFHKAFWDELGCSDIEKKVRLKELKSNLRSQSNWLSWNKYRPAAIILQNAIVSLDANPMEEIKYTFSNTFLWVKVIGLRIQYQNYNFGDSIKILRERTEAAEKFIQERGTEYIKTLGQNLTAVIEEHVQNYIRMIIREAHTKIGRCKPLTYIYEHSLEMVCQRMIDPINGYWMGLLVAALLLIPVLCIAHRLQCLYRQHKLVPIWSIREPTNHQSTINRCPFCTANPIRMPGGDISGVGQDSAEREISDKEESIEESVNINDGDGKNKLD